MNKKKLKNIKSYLKYQYNKLIKHVFFITNRKKTVFKQITIKRVLVSEQ